VFDRPKDWLDIEELIRWATPIDRAQTLRWVGAILGPDSAPYARLAALLAPNWVELGHTRLNP
jgi:hypothetical protein